MWRTGAVTVLVESSRDHSQNLSSFHVTASSPDTVDRCMEVVKSFGIHLILESVVLQMGGTSEAVMIILPMSCLALTRAT